MGRAARDQGSTRHRYQGQQSYLVISDRTLLTIAKVFLKLRSRERYGTTKGAVYGKQRQVDAYQLGGEPEKPENVVHRYFLRPLVGLGDCHRRSDEWPPHARSTRKGTLFGKWRIILEVSSASLRHTSLGGF